MNSYYWIGLWIGVSAFVGTLISWHTAGVVTGVWFIAWLVYQMKGDIPQPNGQ